MSTSEACQAGDWERECVAAGGAMTDSEAYQAGTAVYVITPQGHRLTGRIVEAEHEEVCVTSRSWCEMSRVVTVRWDEDGDLTNEELTGLKLVR